MKLGTFRLLLFLSIFLSLCSHLGAQTNGERLDAFFSSSQTELNGNALVAEKGKVLYQRSFGWADAKNRLPNGDDSKFDIASITKTFTSTAILQLKENGKLDLESPVTKYFPDFPYEEITVRHLLSHTSGLTDNQIFEDPVKAFPDRVFTNADIIPALKGWKRPLLFKPGEGWSYSNPGYSLLALLVEKLTGLQFENYVRRYIFEPAKMNESYFETDVPGRVDPKKAKNQRYPQFYSRELRDVGKATPKWNGFTGNGGVILTARDLLKFDQVLYSGKLLKPATMDEAFTPVKLKNGTTVKTDVLEAGYGLGWFIFEDVGGEKIVWHGGGRPGVVTVFLRNITRNRTVIVFDNSFNRGTYRTGLNAMNLLAGKSSVPRKRSLVRDYGITLVEKGVDAAFSRLVELKADAENFYVDEDEMNALAYQLLYEAEFEKHGELALETAKLNVALFPNSFNVYDTYGEILAVSGKKEEAVAMYKRSIAINPKNEEGKKALEKLLKK